MIKIKILILIKINKVTQDHMINLKMIKVH